ncbi:uncharacterized protein LOC131153810 [Malania oleifera]|uniref:uncharacterized protein LOC131153810 n=1 Tax=Malania oleifera TaxID=397392 RepID=UPI0025ADE58F|nr:uncharacterized protein LOC131153810 [Malania oleifera]
MFFNPLVVILKENKLVGPNYTDWKRNLDIVLAAEEYKYVLVEHQSMPSMFDIMWNLKKMFGNQNCATRQTAMKECTNTTMAEGTLVKDHVLKMIGFLNELEILGAEINREIQVDIVL